MAPTGQTWAQTVQPTHSVGSMVLFPSFMQTAGQPTFRHFLQPMHLSASTSHKPMSCLIRLISRHGRRVMIAAGTGEARASSTAFCMAFRA